MCNNQRSAPCQQQVRAGPLDSAPVPEIKILLLMPPFPLGGCQRTARNAVRCSSANLTVTEFCAFLLPNFLTQMTLVYYRRNLRGFRLFSLQLIPRRGSFSFAHCWSAVDLLFEGNGDFSFKRQIKVGRTKL